MPDVVHLLPACLAACDEFRGVLLPHHPSQNGMAWLVIAFIVLPAAGVLLLLPYSSFRMAVANRTRLDGTRSSARSRRERKHASDFAVSIVLVPIIVVAVVGSALIVVHEFIAPIPLLLDIMGAYQVDAEAWERAIEREDLGDVGAEYEAWSAKRGFGSTSARFWQDTLWGNWLTLLVLLAGCVAVFYVAVSKLYIRASVEYQKGVTARSEEYVLRDLTNLLRT